MRGTFEVSEQVQRSILLWAAGCITTAAASSSLFRKAFSIVLIVLEEFSKPAWAILAMLFFPVFEFGEREFDTSFEMGDTAQVLDGLRKLAHRSRSQHIKEAFDEMGWSLQSTQTATSEQMQLAV